MRKTLLLVAILWSIVSVAQTKTPISVYGSWHCGNDGCAWATGRNAPDPNRECCTFNCDFTNLNATNNVIEENYDFSVPNHDNLCHFVGNSPRRSTPS
jgi:hypothetical protein